MLYYYDKDGYLVRCICIYYCNVDLLILYFKVLMKAVSGMESNFATAKVCSYKDPTKCDLSLEPGELDKSRPW